MHPKIKVRLLLTSTFLIIYLGSLCHYHDVKQSMIGTLRLFIRQRIVLDESLRFTLLCGMRVWYEWIGKITEVHLLRGCCLTFVSAYESRERELKRIVPR